MTDDDAEAVRRSAADWFARLRAPGGAADAAAYRTWREADSANARAYDRLVERWQDSAVLANSDLVAASPLRPTLFARMRRAPPVIMVPTLVAAAAILVLVIRVPSSAPTSSPYASAVGQIRIIVLTDGTLVTLDTASAIAPVFTGGARRVRLLRGRARFVVSPDAARPFVVLAGSAVIVDRGTVFDVGYQGKAVAITLIQGRVEVHRAPAMPAPTRATLFPTAQTPAPAPATLAAVALVPGERLTLPPAGVIAPPRVVPPDSNAWVSGLLVFDAVPLSDVLAEANRYSAIKVRLGDRQLGALAVTGGFRAGAPADLAAALASLFGLHVDRTAGGDLVLVRAVDAARGKPGG